MSISAWARPYVVDEDTGEVLEGEFIEESPSPVRVQPHFLRILFGIAVIGSAEFTHGWLRWIIVIYGLAQILFAIFSS